MRIEVKAKPGRIARTAPDGPFIPDDEYVAVELTPYVDRLLNVWGDIEQRSTEAVKPPVKKPAAEADKKETS
jgi:hypothetical protein